MMRNGKKGVGYTRVSGPIQGDGTSLDTQAAAIVDLANSLGYEIASEDMLAEVRSGVSLERPQLDKIRRMAAAGEFGALFVYTTDRLSRDPVDLLLMLREFDGHGVAVHFVQDPSDNSPEGKLVKFVLGYSASREHAQIRERTMRGRMAVARAGRMPVGSSDGTYGYDYSKATKARTVNAAEAKVVKRIFRLFTNGWSMSGIAEQLNKDGIPTKKGLLWRGATIREMLANESYIGFDYYGRTKEVVGKDGKKKRIEAPREEWIEITGYTTPIISEKVFEKARKRLVSIQARFRGRNERRYMLTGIAVCGRCGGWISGNGGVRRYRYYRCNSRVLKYVPGAAERDCGAPSIRVEWLEDQVWSIVVAMVQDPSTIISDLELNLRTGGGEIGKEIERLRGDVRKIEQEEVRLLGLYRRGTVRLDLLEAEMEALSDKSDDLRGRLVALEEQRQKEENMAEAGNRIREYCQRVSEGLEELDDEGKRTLMFNLGIRVLAVKGDVMVMAELDSGFLANAATT